MRRNVLVNAKDRDFFDGFTRFAMRATSSGHDEMVMKRSATFAKRTTAYVDGSKLSAAGYRRDHRDDVARLERMTRHPKLFTDCEPALGERSAQDRVNALEPRGKRANVHDFPGQIELVLVSPDPLAHGGKVEDRDASCAAHEVPSGWLA